MNMNMRRRGSANASDGDDTDNNGRRRQPFRPLQPLRASSSPTQPVSKSTPPREVFLTPRATPKPIKRKASSRLKRPMTKVKSEPPEIDISKVRPASPSDDPLLLLGTRSTRSPPLRARFTPAFSSSPPNSACADHSMSFATRLSGARTNVLLSATSSSHDGVHALPVFHAPRAVEEPISAWSDSDDDGFNLTGEYTGKFKILKIPTKADPPTSGTREHMALWGRPVSPFPFSAIMERSLPLSEPTEDTDETEGIFDSTMRCGDVALDAWEVATEPPLSDVEHSPPPSVSEDEFADLDEDFPVFDVDAESTQVLPPAERTESVTNPDEAILEEQEEEAQIDRELSVAIDDGPDTLSKTSQVVDPMRDDSSDDEDDVEGEDIIKITSEDPRAAARAATILRMHNYDCILAAERKKRSSKSTRKRRKTIGDAGISKSYAGSRSHWWKTLEGCETSPGSRSLPLLELWRDAEDSVFLEHHFMSYCDTSFTLSPLKVMTSRPGPLLPPPGGEWSRECWKCLDKCLVAERLAAVASRGTGTDLLADTGDISKDAVLSRFVNQLGGESVLVGLGPEWSRDNLILRLDVLIKKQSRQATGAQMFARRNALDATEPRYRGLLQEAMALSGTTERCQTSVSIASETTVVSGRHDTGRVLPDPLYLEPGWQTSVRGPIRTPSRTPDPRPPHPKDQVHLRHPSLPQKSMIPVAIRPKRLVDLRHLSPMKTERGVWRPTARRSSGFSVKELVKQFEGLDK